MQIQTETNTTLSDAWNQLLEREGSIRIRDAAKSLGVSEAELLETKVGDTVTPLKTDFPGIFRAFREIGEVMASTRNEWAVIEKTGTFDRLHLDDAVGVVLDREIDLRIFFAQFGSAFAVVNPDHSRGPLHSVQFFDKSGDSIHKVYVRSDGDVAAWKRLVETFAEPAYKALTTVPRTGSALPRPKSEDEIRAFQNDWLSLTDTHEFFPMLRAHDFERVQALEAAPPAIMVFVGSRGLIEIHSGPVERIVETGTWINVLDARFNLHLQRKGIAEIWVVRKPTEDGIVTSLEVFDSNGETIAMLFGERKPGVAELEEWRAIVAKLEPLS